MSEKRFKMEIPINNGNHPLLKDNETGEIVEIVNVEMLIKKMNEQQDIIEKLQQKIDAYERLITNSYEGKEETLDGYDGMYVIWESELKEWRKKYD